MTRRYPLPVPFGWFAVAWSDEVAPGEARAVYALDRHLVAWRDEGGAAHVQDAFCPHLGAHLGHGGTVVGDEIQCPFHGWRFDGAGTNTAIPYSDRCNARARVRSFPTVERHGALLAWWHPDPDVAPQWAVPVVDELAGDEWRHEVRAEHTFDAHLQELAENQVDSAHFRFVHNNAHDPVITSYEPGFPTAVMHAAQVIDTPAGEVDATLEVTSIGMGMSVVRFFGVVDTIDVAFTTPVTAEQTIVRSVYRFRDLGDPELTELVGTVFVDEVQRQMVREDGPIWEHKAYLPRPALARGDGPFGRFRAWAAQFHPEPVLDEGGKAVWPSPHWPDRMDERPEGISSVDRIEHALIARDEAALAD